MVINYSRSRQWIKRFQTNILKWYTANKRDLPWRNTNDSYRIWISEVMLQQTQAATVIPYYTRFINKFPNASALAQASQSEVLKAWESLGYYSRARNLHAAAAEIVSDHAGQFPNDLQLAHGLPGVGPYIAAAVLSIAYNQDVAVVDGNIQRVLCRVLNIRQDPRANDISKFLHQAAQEFLPTGKAASYNQGIMELGALVCTPKVPQCSICPINSLCIGLQHGNPKALPIKPPKKAKPHYNVAVGLIWRDGELLVAKRPSNGLLGGLWELPGGKMQNGESLQEAVIRKVHEELGVKVTVERHFMTVNHAYSHFRITMHAFHCRYVSGQPQAVGCDEWRWAKPDDLRELAFPRANGKLLERLWKDMDTCY